MENEKLDAALEYASFGWHVLPVLPNEKLPASLHGVNDATTDPEQIKRWWTANPDFNIGIAAGEKSGLIVFDIDPRNGGDESWKEWTEAHGGQPDGLSQMTAGGGVHYLAEYTPAIRSCKIGDGIDVLSDGRYFLAAPSKIGDREYYFDGTHEDVPFEIPARWLSAYVEKVNDRTSKITAGSIIRGNRNDGLAAIAGAMRNLGMAEDEILAALTKINENRCEVPLATSEVNQIARSIGRYEPDGDLAASAALGSMAAAELLRGGSSDYFLTKASSFLSQPAPLQWTIKHWIPEGGLSMLYGESGAGKTFITLDMACCIATGREWKGNRTKPGVVVYLCGEGNFGFRLRVAAWAKKYDTTGLDNLIVSNRAIDLNSMTAMDIVKAVHDVTNDPVSIVFIDTLNNHMAGDENSAKDTRQLVNACKTVISELRCSVCLNHHIGHGGEAKGRARGSSAWKASLDSSILISQGSSDIVTVSSTKMKDAKPPAELHGRLEQVELDWLNEDGEKETSAVFEITDEVPQVKKEKGIPKHCRTFSNAWFASGAEDINGTPYVSRSAFIQYLENDLGMTHASAKQSAKPSYERGIISELLTSEMIVASGAGWVVNNPAWGASMLLSRGKG
jgi:energy-coupling factor transporter ATP-binding protein EcfA2